MLLSEDMAGSGARPAVFVTPPARWQAHACPRPAASVLLADRAQCCLAPLKALQIHYLVPERGQSPSPSSCVPPCTPVPCLRPQESLPASGLGSVPGSTRCPLPCQDTLLTSQLPLSGTREGTGTALWQASEVPPCLWIRFTARFKQQARPLLGHAPHLTAARRHCFWCCAPAQPCPAQVDTCRPGSDLFLPDRNDCQVLLESAAPRVLGGRTRASCFLRGLAQRRQTQTHATGCWADRRGVRGTGFPLAPPCTITRWITFVGSSFEHKNIRRLQQTGWPV